MTCLALALCAQIAAGGDTLTLEPHPVHAGQLTYQNSAQSLTTAGDYRLCFDGICVDVMLNTALYSPSELLRITPPDGYLAVPEEAVVPDGESVTVLILAPMF